MQREVSVLLYHSQYIPISITLVLLTSAGPRGGRFMVEDVPWSRYHWKAAYHRKCQFFSFISSRNHQIHQEGSLLTAFSRIRAMLTKPVLVVKEYDNGMMMYRRRRKWNAGKESDELNCKINFRKVGPISAWGWAPYWVLSRTLGNCDHQGVSPPRLESMHALGTKGTNILSHDTLTTRVLCFPEYTSTWWFRVT
jgi:hypothetical protein